MFWVFIGVAIGAGAVVALRRSEEMFAVLFVGLLVGGPSYALYGSGHAAGGTSLLAVYVAGCLAFAFPPPWRLRGRVRNRATP